MLITLINVCELLLLHDISKNNHLNRIQFPVSLVIIFRKTHVGLFLVEFRLPGNQGIVMKDTGNSRVLGHRQGDKHATDGVVYTVQCPFTRGFAVDIIDKGR